MKYTFEISPYEFDEAIADRLKETYVDQVTNWSHEPYSENFCNALLTVIEFWCTPKEYAEWYETIKEL